MKVLVCGSGSIGRRHIENILAFGHDVLVWRFSEKFKESLSGNKEITFYYDLDGAIEDSDAVVIATATDSHIDICHQVIRAGKAFYLEKPISHNIDCVSEIKKSIYQKNLYVEVGCQLRSHPALVVLRNHIASRDNGPLYSFFAVVGQRLDSWRPGTDYTRCYSADKRRGGGALFDLIHEIDLMLWLCGGVKEVFAEQSQLSDQSINADDLTNLVLILANGAVGQIQMDMLSPVYRRSFELVFQKAIYRWDYVAGSLEFLSGDQKEVLYSNEVDFDRNSIFLCHMGHFLGQVKNAVSTCPRCSFADGVEALRVACAAQLSSSSGRKVRLKEVL